MVIEQILNSMNYFSIILILSFVVTIFSTLVYSYVTDQALIKRVKEDIKKLRDKQKKVKSDHKKFMDIQQQMMDKNMVVMKQSFRPMIYTFIPLILVFAWMSANLAFQPIDVNDEFLVTVNFVDDYNSVSDLELDLPSSLELVNDSFEVQDNNIASFKLRALEKGEFSFSVFTSDFSYDKEVLVTDSKSYLNPVSDYDDPVNSIVVEHEPVKPLGDFSLFGWNPGWLGTYIILSVFFSLISRKILGVK